VTVTATPPIEHPPRRQLGFWGWVFAVICLGFAAFWVWALFFASKEAVNKIGDRAWAERAEGICATAVDDLDALHDYRRIERGGPEEAAQLAERGDIVDRATGIVERMLDDVVAVEPTDAKGRAIVPQWQSDYRTYIGNRRDYADVLRAGRDEPFREAAVDGIPISDKLTRFAGDNDMPSCAPPTDLAS
jgi:hypothetical protein